VKDERLYSGRGRDAELEGNPRGLSLSLMDMRPVKVAVLAGWMLAACTTMPSPSEPLARSSSIRSSSVPAVSSTQTRVFLATAAKPSKASLLALAFGTLVKRKGCVLLQQRGIAPAIVIWPYGYAVERRGKSLRLMNRRGSVVARIGEAVKLTGGWTLPRLVRTATAEPIPDRCPAHSYFVGSP
jgi:hypothetical protein